MKRLSALLTFILLFAGTSQAALFEAKSPDAQPSVLYGKTSGGAIVPIKVDSSGIVDTSGGGLPTTGREIHINPTIDLGDTVAAVQAAGVPASIYLSPGTYTECSVAVTAPVQISILGSGSGNTIINCSTNTTTTLFAFSGQDSTSYINISDLTVNLTSSSGTLKGIAFNQAGATLSDKQIVLNNLIINVSGTGQSDGVYIEDSGYTVTNVIGNSISTATGSNVRGLYQIIASTSTAETKAYNIDSYWNAESGATNSSFSGRGTMHWYTNSTHSYPNTVYMRNTTSRAKAESGGESVGCYCVNDDTTATYAQTCYYVNSFCEGYSTNSPKTGTQRALRATTNSIGTLIVYLYGTVLKGTDYPANLIQKSGTNVDIIYDGMITAGQLKMDNSEWPVSIYSSTGAALDSIDLIEAVGMTGRENASATGTSTGGEGGDVLITLGTGGAVTATTGAGNGGTGGDFVVTGGVGGAASNTGTTNTGGAGSDINLTAGIGGNATNGATANNGGVGGSIYLGAAAGGTGATANGRSGTLYLGQTASTTAHTGYTVLNMPYLTIAADDTTPDVRYSSEFITSANTGATAITDLDNPTVGQIVCITGGSSTNASTIADSGNFNLSASMTLNLDDRICLKVQADNDYVEISRTDN